MKRYIIRINCACFQDIEVKAESEEEATETALNEFQCPADSPELGEVITPKKKTK